MQVILIGWILGFYFGFKPRSGDEDDVSPPSLVVTLTLAGTVADFPQTTLTSLCGRIATAAGLEANAATCTVTAASVLVRAALAIPPGMTVQSVVDTLDTAFESTAMASLVLGVTVELLPTFSDASGQAIQPLDDLPSSAEGAFQLIGHWLTTSGSAVTVSDDKWVSIASWGISTYTIELFTSEMVIMQNAPDASYNAGKWSKIEYHTNADGSTGFCQTLFAADTADDAMKTATDHLYDPTNSTHGCGGQFSHSDMTRI